MVKRSNAANEANVMPGMHSPPLGRKPSDCAKLHRSAGNGKLSVPVSEARAMLDRLASRQVAGKLILGVNPS
jgi:hypothetical protein